MGAARARAAGALLARPRDAARRCRASDAADAGAGRQHGDRGRRWCWRAALRRMTTSRPRSRATMRRASNAPRKLVRGANEMAKRFHNPALADAAGARAYVDAQWSEATVKQRYDWIFSIRRDHAWRSDDDAARSRRSLSSIAIFALAVPGAGVAVALRRRDGPLRREVDLPAAGRVHGARLRDRRVAVLDAERVRRLAEHRRSAVDAHLAAACAARAGERGAGLPGDRWRDVRVSVPRRARRSSCISATAAGMRRARSSRRSPSRSAARRARGCSTPAR